jgi:hypothetical protein
MSNKITKKNPRGAGRIAWPASTVKGEREVCMFRPAERKNFIHEAKERKLSRSNLLRAGLRALGIQLDEDKKLTR